MQRLSTDELSSSSFTSSDMDMDIARQEELLIEKYGGLQLKQRALLGKLDNLMLLSIDHLTLLHPLQCPIDQLPVKSKRTVPTQRGRSHLDVVGWSEPVAVPVNASRTVLDI
ncbi:hypothetical protein VOLCADRAFT_95424 [Volvox carteri f. nagariensis]|uniref:Uncharacterized protein n=1 Tax=Volvox carteri f. nagariensis TaxID=3068 RepID=D8U7E9_VOLCA|nr:uncharacterized protein VOLCADRAFT_95424 [Volvox carteri f. nagariensis]EFJ44224.1 hypothetical protein VOLCADRAFT_95424 [Volvox carteri f. nagariensis]|eukprot:XP_002954583.1 hypothetical protein VOLCADRAFT_95424 [Volvox carteri f. nagariensis]